MITNPIFIVGTERSGSNLLRLLLNELPEVTVPHPPHLMRDLSRVLPRYGDLKNDRAFLRLISDAVRLVELHFAPWPVKLDTEAIARDCVKRDLYSVYAAIYEQYRVHVGKRRWGCKSTFMIHHVQDVLDHHPRPQFIHLVRDPRDVAVSARKSVFCHYHPYYVAKLWRREQETGRNWSERLEGGAWMTLRYEDLIADPAAQMRRVCGFLDATYSDDLLRFFERPAARELSSLSRSWENVGRPVLSGNKGKFREELKEDEVETIEKEAGHLMRDFGYEPVTSVRPGPASLLARARYSVSENAQMWREEIRALKEDRNARFRLRKKTYLWWLSWR